MKKCILLIVITLFFLGCSQENSTYEPTAHAPDTVVMKVGVHPYLNSKKMYHAYRPILDYLQKHIDNVEFVLETSKTYATYNKKLFQGEFEFSLPNPYQTSVAIKKHYRVIAKMRPDKVFRGIFVARKDQHLRSFTQLQGETLSFPAPTALAATMMPLYFLHQQGIDTKKDIKKRYVGSQYSSILNAFSGDSIAGATWPPPWESWCKDNPEKAEYMEVVWQTEPLINNGFIVRDDVDPRIAEKVVEVLVEMSNDTEGRELLFLAGFEGFEKADNARYKVVDKFLRIYDERIGLP